MKLVRFLVPFVAVALIFGAAPQKKAAPAKKAAASKTGAKAASSKSAKSKSSKKKGRTSASWRNRQMTPSPERYQEIEKALVERGYLTGEPDGKWDTASIAALKRFQEEQNLSGADGKIDSMSLILLGLGPKYEARSKTAAPPPLQP